MGMKEPLNLIYWSVNVCQKRCHVLDFFFKKKKRKPPLLSNLQGLERIFWNEFLLTCIGLSFSDCSDAAQVLAANAEEAVLLAFYRHAAKAPAVLVCLRQHWICFGSAVCTLADLGLELEALSCSFRCFLSDHSSLLHKAQFLWFGWNSSR